MSIYFSKNDESVARPLPGIYHIRDVCERYLIEDGNNIYVKNSLRKRLFRLSHNNDDGTISLFSLARNEYVRSTSRIGFLQFEEIAKFELLQPKKPSKNGRVMLLVNSNMKFLRASLVAIDLCDSEDDASMFEFVPERE